MASPPSTIFCGSRGGRGRKEGKREKSQEMGRGRKEGGKNEKRRDRGLGRDKRGRQ